MVAAKVNDVLLTVPETASRLGVPLDRLRRQVGLAEPDLVIAGVLVRAGRHRLLREDRIEGLMELLAK